MINAEADVSKAYEMAIEQLEPFAAKLYFEAGAQSLPIVENCIDKARWDQLKLIVRMGIIRPHHMVTVLENAVRSNNEQLTAQLVEWEQSREARPLVVRYALNHDEKGVKALLKTTLLVTDPLMDIAKMADRPEAERVAAMKIIVRAADDIVGWTTYHSGFTRSNLIAIELVDQLKAGNHEVVKLMIAAGVPTFDILTDSARSADIVTVQRLLNLGATVAPVLRHDGNSSKKWFVLLASAAIKDRILEPKRVNNEPKIRMLKAWLGCGDGVKKAARELLRDEVKAGRYDHVKVLIAGGVPITESLMDLGRTADRPTAIKVMRLEEDATSAKIDAASAINQLIANSKEFAAKGDDEAACAEQNAANVLAVALATFASISAAQVGSAN